MPPIGESFCVGGGLNAHVSTEFANECTMTDNRQAMFTKRYADGETPWDSGVTPPEIMELLADLPAGRAFDLGCGTGTVMRELLRHGWRADGIDFVQKAIDLASAKLAAFPAESYQLFHHDVTRLYALPELRRDYDMIIDIGCGHNLGESALEAYASAIAESLAPGGLFMLYAAHPRPESLVGWAPKLVERAFGRRLDLLWEQRGNDRAIGAPVSWYKLRKSKSMTGGK